MNVINQLDSPVDLTPNKTPAAGGWFPNAGDKTFRISRQPQYHLDCMFVVTRHLRHPNTGIAPCSK